jgi:hypothetical protein
MNFFEIDFALGVARLKRATGVAQCPFSFNK